MLIRNALDCAVLNRNCFTPLNVSALKRKLRVSLLTFPARARVFIAASRYYSHSCYFVRMKEIHGFSFQLNRIFCNKVRQRECHFLWKCDAWIIEIRQSHGVCDLSRCARLIPKVHFTSYVSYTCARALHVLIVTAISIKYQTCVVNLFKKLRLAIAGINNRGAS